MCSAVDSKWRSAVTVVSLLMLGGSAGCGRPQGVLFPALESPRVWPASPETPRIRLLGTLGGSDDLRAAQTGLEVLASVLRGPRPPIRFSGPTAVAVRSDGFVAVADVGRGAVHIIDLERRTHRMIFGFEDERIPAPVGVTWAGERLFVTDAKRHEVIEFDSQGRYRARFGADLLIRPVGLIYVASRDQLYVVDGGSHRLMVFDTTGGLVRSIGQRGSGPGEFNFPTHIGWAGDRLAIADSGNFRVQLLDLDGRFFHSIGRKGDGAGDLSMPKGVAFDSEGHVYVVDAHFENVQVFDSSGALLMAFGREGTQPGDFNLPAGLAIDAGDRIWVADSGNHRLQVFAYVRASS